MVREVSALNTVQTGEVLVAEITDPDWEPVMRRVAAIVTDKGGRTAHAAIVSREFGLPCIVGTERGTTTLHDGDEVTVCCAEGAEGHVYADAVPTSKITHRPGVIGPVHFAMPSRDGGASQHYVTLLVPADDQFTLSQWNGISASARYQFAEGRAARQAVWRLGLRWLGSDHTASRS